MKSGMRWLLTVLTVCFALPLLLALRPAHAEIPILESNAEGGDYGGFERPQFVPNARIMYFVMGRLQSDEDIDVVSFDYKAGERIKGVAFIPVNDDLRDFAPTVALIGPGLPKPATPLPFALPAGMGAVLSKPDLESTYFDIFTQINFYPRATVETQAIENGTHYMVVYGKATGDARYALDIGIEETYAAEVLARYPVNWWEVRGATGWGHWPAILYVSGAAGLLVSATRRRFSEGARQLLRVVALVTLVLTIALTLIEELWLSGAQGSHAFWLIPALVIGCISVVVLLAHAGVPVREHLTPEQFAAEDPAVFSRFADVDGYALRFTDQGPRMLSPVVLLHGFGSSLFTFRQLEKMLLDAGHRVILIDLLGSGASARATEPVYTTQHHARLIGGLLRKQGVARATLGGHSFGARVAMQLALLEPKLARALILIAPEAFATQRPLIAKLVGWPLIGYALAFFATSPSLVKAGLAAVSRRRAWLTPETVRGYIAPLRVKGTLAAQIATSLAPKDEAQLSVPASHAQIDAPALVLWGDADPVFPVQHGVTLCANMPHAALNTYAGAGHVPHEEQFDAVSTSIISWLSNQDPS
jgi:pimeloyl-ACP methyl ester carboxylesterase